MSDERDWRIGELARATGVTVRTLHHYDEIGLLRPKRRTGSNYRQYTGSDVRRLQQILSLRQLGLSLEEIAEWLGRPGTTTAAVIERHLSQLREREHAIRQLRERLERLAGHLRSSEEVSTEEFIQTMEMMTMFEKYYTPEQLRQLEERRKSVGEERIREVEGEWPRLMAEVQAEMERGTDPSDPRVQELARRWKSLVEEFTGGDPGITQSLNNLYENETEVRGMDVAGMRPMMEYIQKAGATDRTG